MKVNQSIGYVFSIFLALSFFIGIAHADIFQIASCSLENPDKPGEGNKEVPFKFIWELGNENQRDYAKFTVGFSDDLTSQVTVTGSFSHQPLNPRDPPYQYESLQMLSGAVYLDEVYYIPLDRLNFSMQDPETGKFYNATGGNLKYIKRLAVTGNNKHTEQWRLTIDAQGATGLKKILKVYLICTVMGTKPVLPDYDQATATPHPHEHKGAPVPDPIIVPTPSGHADPISPIPPSYGQPGSTVPNRVTPPPPYLLDPKQENKGR